MAFLLAIPVFSLLVILQSAVVSRLQLIHGSADLVLLVIVAWSLQERVKQAWVWAVVGAGMIALISALPVFAIFSGYLLAMGMARLLQRRVWQAPVLAMFLTTAVATILYHLISVVLLKLYGSPMTYGDAFSLVTLPSTFLNILLALPVYTLVTDLANLVYPAEDEI